MSKVESAKITNPSGIKDEAAHIILEGAWKYFVLEEVRELGKHVLSFWVKGKTSGSMAVSYADEQQEVSVTTDWQRVVFKFNADCYTNPWIYFSGTEYWMYNTQLELGDFATDYGRNPADVEQEIADTKEQVEQYRKETAAEILITQDKITQSVTGLEERISKDYYTKTETSSIIAQTQTGILQTVSANIAETKTYADTTATNAKNAAIADTANKLKGYSTTTQMNSAIDQRANSITSTVNAQITETKTYADTAATNAKNAAIADTANKLKSYSTTTQMTTQIAQTQNSILQSVSATYATNGTVDQVKSSVASVELTANKVNWLVKSGNSASNFTLTDRTAELVANYINIKGLVQFSGLDSNAQTVINNANENAQSAKNIVSSWSSASNTTLIDGGKIYTGSITAEKLNVTDLSALGATLGGWTVDAYGIAAKQLPRREILLHRWDDPNQPFPYIFYVYDTNIHSQLYIGPECNLQITSSHNPALSVDGRSSFKDVSASSISLTGSISGISASFSGKLEVTGNAELKSDVALGKSYSKLGFFGTSPVTKRIISALSTSASLTTTVSKVNDLISKLKEYGLLGS